MNTTYFRVIAPLLMLASCVAGPTPDPVPVGINGMVENSVYVESFDGTRIAVTVHRPSVDGKPVSALLPVVLTQDRADASERIDQAMQPYLAAGYVWISQDRRGTGASFGKQTGFVNQLDAGDAKAIIEWSAKQDFSSGKTVAMGCSNQGVWQYLTATLQPESLVAIAPACSSPMLFDDAVQINGIPMIETAAEPYRGECKPNAGGARPGDFTPPPPQPVDEDADGALVRAAQEEQRCGSPMLGQYWLNMPRDAMNDFAGYQPALLDTAMTNWQAIRDSGVAVLQLGGWFDAAVAGQLDAQPLWKGRLVMGPWVHGNRPPPGASLANAERNLTAMTIAFFDHYAKGIANGAERPAITYYTMNAPAGQEWRTTDQWPNLPREEFLFGSDATLTAIRPQGLSPLVLGPGATNWFDGRYTPLNRYFAGDFSATNADSLLLSTKPLPGDRELTGTARASIWITSDRPDANLFAMLQDVAPDGTITYVTDGRIRASWRAEQEPPFPSQRSWHRGYAADISPIVPGEPVLLHFDFFPTSYILAEGHRLQLSLASSIGKPWQQPPLAGGPVTISILRDGEHASGISLPLQSP